MVLFNKSWSVVPHDPFLAAACSSAIILFADSGPRENN